ncbi:hypothetical protein [Motiliproteus sp. MSK22-1]|nr:hypothetical protein [Motiliproteus sp. MSK22-1]
MKLLLSYGIQLRSVVVGLIRQEKCLPVLNVKDNQAEAQTNAGVIAREL